MNEQIAGFVSGTLSGMTKLLVGHPFDTIKVRLQTTKLFTSPLQCLFQTIQKEGVLGLYKGSSPPMVGWALMDSVQMGTLTTMRQYLKSSRLDGKLTLSDQAVSGFVAGMTTTVIATPIEVLKANLQIQTKTRASLFKLIKQFVNEQGIFKLYQGFHACLLFRSFFWLLWSSYEVYSRLLLNNNYSKKTSAFVAGGLAATTFWVTSFPFDTIKNKLMTKTIDSPFNNMVECARYIYRMDGFKGFYRGYVPCLLRSFPTNASAIFVFELSHKLLSR